MNEHDDDVEPEVEEDVEFETEEFPILDDDEDGDELDDPDDLDNDPMNRAVTASIRWSRSASSRCATSCCREPSSTTRETHLSVTNC